MRKFSPGTRALEKYHVTRGSGFTGWQPDRRSHQSGRDRQDLSSACHPFGLAKTEKASIRQRELPAHVVVYYVIALALYMQSSYREVLRCLLEGIQWLRDPSAAIKVTGKSGISQARTRLSWEPLRQLHDELVQPIAVHGTKARGIASGAW